MKPESARLLSHKQGKIAATAITLSCFILIAGLLVFVFVILQKIVAFFAGVIWPLATAGILAMLLKPVVSFLENRIKLSRVRSIVVLYVIVSLAALGIMSVILPSMIGQTTDLFKQLPSITSDAVEFLKRHLPILFDHISRETIVTHFEAIIDGVKQMAIVSIPAVREVGQWLVQVFGKAAALAIIPIYLFYFLETRRDPSKDFEQQLTFLEPEIRRDIVFLMREFATIMVAFFRGQLFIGLIMGVLLALGFSVVGLRFGLILGFAVGLLNIVPYLGTLMGLSMALPIAYFQTEGGWILVSLTLSVFITVQILEGYVLTPKIMGRQTGLHPLAVIISLFFWGTALNGILGMILAIPLTAFFVVAWRLLKSNYLDSATPE